MQCKNRAKGFGISHPCLQSLDSVGALSPGSLGPSVSFSMKDDHVAPRVQGGQKVKEGSAQKGCAADLFMSGSNVKSTRSSEGESNAVWPFAVSCLPSLSVCMLAIQEYCRPFSWLCLSSRGGAYTEPKGPQGFSRAGTCQAFQRPAPSLTRVCLCPIPPKGCLRASPTALRLVPPETSGALPVGGLVPAWEEPCFRSHKLSRGR